MVMGRNMAMGHYGDGAGIWQWGIMVMGRNMAMGHYGDGAEYGNGALW